MIKCFSEPIKGTAWRCFLCNTYKLNYGICAAAGVLYKYTWINAGFQI